MKKFINGKYVDITDEELALMQSKAEQYKDEIPGLSYGELVDMEIRKRYTASEEFAILRQKDEKPSEYAEYYAYCEECKAKVKGEQI